MKEKVAYKEGKFVDFTGLERQFVIAAVSIEDNSGMTVSHLKPLNVSFPEYDLTLQKGVYFGISVVHPSDVGTKKIIKDGKELDVPIYNLEVGKTIARNKALKPETNINFVLAYNSGILGSSVIEAMLEQEAKYFITNPSRYLAGYEKARIKYNFEKLNGLDKEKELSNKKAEVEKLEKEIEDLKLLSRKTKN